jgi:hypothetical protein
MHFDLLVLLGWGIQTGMGMLINWASAGLANANSDYAKICRIDAASSEIRGRRSSEIPI